MDKVHKKASAFEERFRKNGNRPRFGKNSPQFGKNGPRFGRNGPRFGKNGGLSRGEGPSRGPPWDDSNSN